MSDQTKAQTRKPTMEDVEDVIGGPDVVLVAIAVETNESKGQIVHDAVISAVVILELVEEVWERLEADHAS